MRGPHPGQEVLGLGIDLVELPRFADFVRRNESSLSEVFTAGELRLPRDSVGRDRALAAAWGFKEAAMKALGTGWGAGIAWTEIEVLGDARQPQVRLHGVAKTIAEKAGVRSICASLANSRSHLVAMVMLVGRSAVPEDGAK